VGTEGIWRGDHAKGPGSRLPCRAFLHLVEQRVRAATAERPGWTVTLPARSGRRSWRSTGPKGNRRSRQPSVLTRISSRLDRRLEIYRAAGAARVGARLAGGGRLSRTSLSQALSTADSTTPGHARALPSTKATEEYEVYEVAAKRLLRPKSLDLVGRSKHHAAAIAERRQYRA